MTALTAFELLLMAERARVTRDEQYRDMVLDKLKNELARCIREMLTPPEKGKTR